MFDRFTERARKVVDLARREARRGGSPELGAKHLLLALLSEDSGSAASLLQKAGVDPWTALQWARPAAAPGPVGTDEAPPAFSDRVRDAFRVAESEADRHGLASIGTEHLLIGVLAGLEPDACEPAHELGPGLSAELQRIRTTIGSS